MAKEKREVQRWITVNGVHVPIFKGQSVKEAVSELINRPKTDKPGGNKDAKDPANKTDKKMIEYDNKRAKEEAHKELHDAVLKYEKIDVDVSHLRATQQDRIEARKELERAQQKLNSLYKRSSEAEANRNSKTISQDFDEKEKQITENKKQAERASGKQLEKAENTLANRNALKQEIDDYVKAHPYPTEEDRKKVSDMRSKYNAMLKEATEKMQAKVAAELAQEEANKTPQQKADDEAFYARQRAHKEHEQQIRKMGDEIIKQAWLNRKKPSTPSYEEWLDINGHTDSDKVRKQYEAWLARYKSGHANDMSHPKKYKIKH